MLEACPQLRGGLCNVDALKEDVQVGQQEVDCGNQVCALEHGGDVAGGDAHAGEPHCCQLLSGSGNVGGKHGNRHLLAVQRLVAHNDSLEHALLQSGGCAVGQHSHQVAQLPVKGGAVLVDPQPNGQVQPVLGRTLEDPPVVAALGGVRADGPRVRRNDAQVLVNQLFRRALSRCAVRVVRDARHGRTPHARCRAKRTSNPSRNTQREQHRHNHCKRCCCPLFNCLHSGATPLSAVRFTIASLEIYHQTLIAVLLQFTTAVLLAV